MSRAPRPIGEHVRRPGRRRTARPRAPRPGPCRRRPRTRPRRCSRSARPAPGSRPRCPRRSRSSGAPSRSTSVSGVEDLADARALDRDQRGRERTVVEDRREAVEALGERVADDLAHSTRWRRRGTAPVAEAVDDQVVDDRRRPGRTIIEYWARPTASVGGFVTSASASARAGVLALDEQLAHVRQVEQPGPLADRPVLLEDARRTGPASASRRTRSAARRARGGGRRAASGGSSAGVERSSVTLRPRGPPARSSPRRAPDVVARAVGDRSPPAARATSARSVSNVSRPGASSNRIQRTCSNSWSCRARSPPVGSIRK